MTRSFNLTTQLPGAATIVKRGLPGAGIVSTLITLFLLVAGGTINPNQQSFLNKIILLN